MKSTIRSGVALGALIASVGVALSAQSGNVFAQSTAPSQHTTHADMRRANHRLEHKVRMALDHAKLDVSDVRVVARMGKVSLEGTVPDATQIQGASSAASGVPGVSSVSNMLSLRMEGN